MAVHSYLLFVQFSNSTPCLLKLLMLSSFQVPIEAERLMENDLVLEQYLPPSSPLLVGFRLDAFSAIKPRVAHSPSSDADVWCTSKTLLEDRYISPAVLYVQVSMLQVDVRPFLLLLLDKFVFQPGTKASVEA